MNLQTLDINFQVRNKLFYEAKLRKTSFIIEVSIYDAGGNILV